MMPQLIDGGVISAQTPVCMACGHHADMWNVLGSFCVTHKENFVREYRTMDDLKSLDVIQDPKHRAWCKQYMKEVWKL